MNVTVTRTSRAVSFASLKAGTNYVAADGDNQFVYTKASSNKEDIPGLLGKNRRGNPVGLALRHSDGRPVFHFLDKQVLVAKATGVDIYGGVKFTV